MQAEAMHPEAMALDSEHVTVKGLPSYLDGDVRLFNFSEDGIDSDTLEWFFAIQDELFGDWERTGRGNSGFVHNQSSILDRFVKGNLYGLCMPETQSMYDNVTPEDPHFMTGCFTGRTRYRFPIFCALLENNRIDILWVADRMRRKGLATLLVSLLKERGVSGADYIGNAMPFWQRLGTVTEGSTQAKSVDFF